MAMAKTNLRDDVPVDEHIIAGGARYEILDGQVFYVPPADEPHAARQLQVGVVVTDHLANGFEAATEMLTRTSELNDFAPDVSVYPTARDPETGGRQARASCFRGRQHRVTRPRRQEGTRAMHTGRSARVRDRGREGSLARVVAGV